MAQDDAVSRISDKLTAKADRRGLKFAPDFLQAKISTNGPVMHVEIDLPVAAPLELRIDAGSQIVIWSFHLPTAKKGAQGELVVHAISLPEPVDPTTLDAAVANGTLTMTMLKEQHDITEQIPPRTIN